MVMYGKLFITLTQNYYNNVSNTAVQTAIFQTTPNKSRRSEKCVNVIEA